MSEKPADEAEAIIDRWALMVGNRQWLQQAVVEAFAAGQRRMRQRAEREALARLNHWRDNCDDNIKAGCAPPQYNMGCRAEAATIMQRITDLDPEET